LEILTAFASQAATAIENAHLYETLKQSIEEQNRLQDQLREQEARRMALEEATKMKNDFIGFISHELRNPLTSIRGFIQTLAVSEGSEIDEKDRKEFYEIIESEADRMMTLLNDLLDSSILEAKRSLKLNLAPMDIRPLIVKIVRSVQFSKYWTEAHRIEMNISENIPEMTADQDRLTQVFLNLLSNAVKYSPEGGLIRVNVCEDSDKIIVSVKDSGLGMTAEQMTRLFEKYERIDREEIQRIPGSGLGLFLTKKLVELHGGSITCDSMQGKGSTFTVCLPIYSPQAA
jgi:signal transduction histidine kinase